jgi:hypothetical protein
VELRAFEPIAIADAVSRAIPPFAVQWAQPARGARLLGRGRALASRSLDALNSLLADVRRAQGAVPQRLPDHPAALESDGGRLDHDD